ncbi:MAG: c-type cytochrome [Gammaproteobacteria bacterium]
MIPVRILQAAVLLAFLALALYFPYWWFGVVPFATNVELPQAEIDRLLAGRNLPDYYAAEPPPVSEDEYLAQKTAFTWCRFCHTVKEGGENRVGPNLYRIFGKPAAVVNRFPYSDAFIQARDEGLVWTPATMAALIADPHGLVPGNRMRYPPMVGYEDNAERRRRILEYLLRETR